MRRPVPTKEIFTARYAVRSGRPPRDLAGEVDARILDAAHEVFLERGLAGASMDEIAGLARAGKPTIYTRFPTKEALFAAVVMRSVAAIIARFEDYEPTGTTIEERGERRRNRPPLGFGRRYDRLDEIGHCGGAPVSGPGEQRSPDGA